MAPPRKAQQRILPKGSTLCYDESQISSCWEDTLDENGRFVSPLKEERGKKVIMIVLKEEDKCQ